MISHCGYVIAFGNDSRREFLILLGNRMGLPRAAINLLLHEAQRSSWSGRVATLGRQHVYISEPELRDMASRIGFSLKPATVSLHVNPELNKQGCLSDDSLFQMLGFEESIRVDQSLYEGAEEQLDLNSPETPAHLQDRFDLVLDSGTIEHIFEIGRAMKHCLLMTKEGGQIVHLTPASNAVNHGLYSVSPTLFGDFYSTCGCDVEKLWLCQMNRNFLRGPWRAYDCLSYQQNWLPLGRLDGSLWLTFAVIRKRPGAKFRIPQQSFYVETWQQSDQSLTQGRNLESDRTTAQPKTLTKAERLLQATAKWPRLHRAADRLIDGWRAFVNRRREKQKGSVPYRSIGTF